ncbi:hypothetical protein ABBQ32_005705 [Trebouxia sp. C0010 RCD-2024]
MADLTQIAQQLKFGSTYERVLACQKLVGLDNSVRSGHEVAKAGLVPVLVALLVQLPTHRRAEVQDQAACLLLEAAASNNGMVQKLSHEELLHLNCVTHLTAALLSGSCVKRARVTAILGMISISTQDQQKPDQLLQYCQTMTMLAVSSVPEVVTVLAQSGSADAASFAMMFKGLEALLQGPVPVECFVQAGALEVLGTLLTTLPLQQSHDLLSSSGNDDDCELENMSAVVQEVWLAAVGVLSQVVVHNPRGSKQILQGPLLAVLMQCCSSPSLEVQQLALAALNSLAAVPEHLPAFSRAGEHILHVALAMQSPSRLVQVHALQLIKVVSPFTGDLAEQLLVQALESLPYNALQADAQCESSDSSSEMA